MKERTRSERRGGAKLWLAWLQTRAREWREFDDKDTGLGSSLSLSTLPSFLWFWGDTQPN